MTLKRRKRLLKCLMLVILKNLRKHQGNLIQKTQKSEKRILKTTMLSTEKIYILLKEINMPCAILIKALSKLLLKVF